MSGETGLASPLPEAGKSWGGRRGGLAFQDFADFVGEILQVEWLLEERDAAFQDAVAKNAVVGVAGNVENFQLRARDGKARDEFASAEARHDDVGDENVNRSSMGGGDFERLDSVGSIEDTVAGFSQVIANEFADTLFVFDEENRLGTGRRAARDFFGGGLPAAGPGPMASWLLPRPAGPSGLAGPLAG